MGIVKPKESKHVLPDLRVICEAWDAALCYGRPHGRKVECIDICPFEGRLIDISAAHVLAHD